MRSTKSRVEAVLSYLWERERESVDKWAQAELRVSWITVSEAFYRHNSHSWDTAFRRVYGQSLTAEFAFREASDRAMLRQSIPLIPYAKDSRQLQLTFGPFVIKQQPSPEKRAAEPSPTVPIPPRVASSVKLRRQA